MSLLLLFFLTSIQIFAYSADPEIAFQIRSFENLQSLNSKTSGPWYVIFDDSDHQTLYKKLRLKLVKLNELKKISVPGSGLNEAEIPAGGMFAWIYKPFWYRPSKDHAPMKQLSARLGMISDVDQAYLNEKKIGETGVFHSNSPQNYDKIRVYPFDPGALNQNDINHLLIKVKPYFKGEPFGILQDTVLLGRTEQVIKDFLTFEFIKVIVLTIYLLVAGYFLFFFFRRKVNYDDLFFVLFTFAISVYFLLRTQLKYDLNLDFVSTKKIESSIVVLLPMLWMHFIRCFFCFGYKKHHQVLDITSICLSIYFLLSNDLMLSRTINIKYNVWLQGTYIVLGLRFLFIRLREKNRDAFLISGSTLALLSGVVVDQLSNREIIVFPRLIGYLFIPYVLSLAVILENKFFRLKEEVEVLNKNLEKKVRERTEQLNQTLGRVVKLKNQQDGDYFLTHLLIKPLIRNESGSKEIQIEFFTKQKKEFQFKDKKYEIGGDISIANDILLRGKKHVVFINADAMGKSIQGAGGAIVLGVVFHAFLSRTQMADQNEKTPEAWLNEAFIEMQNVFETFDCSMLISMFLALIDEETGFMYFINAEHPWGVIYRDQKADFIEDELYMRKIGIPQNQSNFLIKTYQLKQDDVLIVGSDGRDDIRIKTTKDEGPGQMPGEIPGEMNYDESLFLTKVKESGASLTSLVSSLRDMGEITDDLTLIRLAYLRKEQTDPNRKKIRETYEKAIRSYRRRKWDECIQLCEEKFAPSKESACLFQILFYAHSRKKDFKKAAQYMKDYLRHHPHREKDIYHASLIAKNANNNQEAIDYAEQAYMRNPKLIQNNINLVQLYRQADIKARANEILKRTRDLFPDHPKLGALQEGGA